MEQVIEMRGKIPIKVACETLGIPSSTFYRSSLIQTGVTTEKPRKVVAGPHPRALRPEEVAKVLGILHSERFVDQSPAEVYATLLDEGVYLCSLRTMYRILAKRGETKERRAMTRHGNYSKPELLATGPRQVWSWDITKLKGPQKWTYYYLYVLMDIFSRYVVGWMVAERENGSLATLLISEACQKQKIQGKQLVIHSDRGGPMISQNVAQLMAGLGVTKSLSRPQVSNDNPFSEAQFKTLKYNANFPERFGSLEDARSFCRRFFGWYNREHRHSGIGYYTPEDVHYERTEALQELRKTTLLSAFKAHPERFVRRAPKVHPVPKEVWINPPVENVQPTIAELQTDTRLNVSATQQSLARCQGA